MTSDRPTGPIPPPGGAPGAPGGYGVEPPPGAPAGPPYDQARGAIPAGGYPPEGVPPEGAPGAGPEGEGAAGGRNRILIFALMGLGILVILAAVYFLFLRGGGEERAGQPQRTPPAPRPTGPAVPAPGAPAPGVPEGPQPSPYPSLDPGLQADVSESFQQYSSRNPFRCTFACPIPATTTTGATGSTGTSGTTGGTGTSPAPQGGSTSGTQQPSGSTSAVTLKQIIGGNQAVVQVGGQTYTVGVGETFAGNYKLTRIAGNCASFVQGDSPFTLCTGQSVLK